MKKNKLYCSTKGKSLRIRDDLLDQDYINKLNKEERDWLLKFNEEYIGANFTHLGERIHPKKFKTKVVKKTGRKRKVDIYKKSCEDANNSRNRDSYGKAKIIDKLVPINEQEYKKNTYNPEDDIIEKIDAEMEIDALCEKIFKKT